MAVRLLLGCSNCALQVLTHTYHASIITSWGVYVRTLRTPLKFIETTWPSFACIMVSISNGATLERSLRIDSRERGLLALATSVPVGVECVTLLVQ